MGLSPSRSISVDVPTGGILTVDGPVKPETLGVTLPHEHTFIDPRSSWYDPPDSAYERRLAEEPVSLENLWFVRRRPDTNEDNMVLSGIDEAVEEYGHFHRTGGDAVVDVTPKNHGGDPKRVAQVARSTGLTFVMAPATTRPLPTPTTCRRDLSTT